MKHVLFTDNPNMIKKDDIINNRNNNLYEWSVMFPKNFRQYKNSNLTSNQAFQPEMKQYMFVIHRKHSELCVREGPIDTYDFLYYRPDHAKSCGAKYWFWSYNKIISDMAILNVYHDLRRISILNPIYQTYRMAKMLMRMDGKYLEYIRPDLQSEKICVIAVRSCKDAIYFVTCELRTEALKDLHFKTHSSVKL